MTEDKVPARPRQVTTTVVMAIVFDVVLLASLFDTLARLRTPETRAAFDEVLGSPPGNGLGLSTAQVVEALRALVFVSGALGAVALVFAVFVLQRHRAARIGYTVTAALMLVTVPAAGLLPVFVALAAVPMWSRSAREWYAGRAPASSDGDLRTVPLLSQQGPPPSSVPFGSPPAGGEGPGSGAPPDSPGGQPPPLYGPPGYVPPPSGQPAYGQSPYGQSPYGQPAYGQPAYGQPTYPSQHHNPDRRPLTVTIASVLTWIGAGVTATLMLAFVAILAVGGDAFIREFERAAQRSNVTLSVNQAMAVGWTVAAVFLVWSIAAIVLAVLAFRRSNAARIGLVVSSVMTALFSLLGIASGISAITLVLGVTTVVLLFTGGANQWYSRRSGGGFPPQPGSWGPPAQPWPYAGEPQPPYAGEPQPPYAGPPPAPSQPPSERPKPW